MDGVTLMEMTLKKKILVLMSTYNGEEYVAHQLDSLVNQTVFQQLDIAIRDDGSIDNTVGIIFKYMDRYSNISLIQGKNVGCNASFMALLNIVGDYEYYAISDQDDVWYKDKLERAINKIKNSSNNICLYGSRSCLVNRELEGYREKKTQKQLRVFHMHNTLIQNIIPGHTQVMTKDLRNIICNVKLDYEQLYAYDAWITNVAQLHGEIIFDNTAHTLYRQHNDNEFGFGLNIIAWIGVRLKRVQKDEAGRYAKQVIYFCNTYKKVLDRNIYNELLRLFKDQDTLKKRIRNISNSKVYRQKKIETAMFWILYLKGAYKIKQ